MLVMVIFLSLHISLFYMCVDGGGGGAARPGHLIYCFRDIDSRYCRGLSGSAGSVDYIMKQIWLEFNG
jgi:hypothetical protein